MQRQGKTQGLPVCLHINWCEAQPCLNKDLLAEALISYNKYYWSTTLDVQCVQKVTARSFRQNIPGLSELFEEPIAPITQADLPHYLQLFPPNHVFNIILVRLLHLHAQAFSHGKQRDSKPHNGEKTVGPGNSWKSALYCDPFHNSYTHSSYPNCRTRPHFWINIKLNTSNSLSTTLKTQRKFLYYNAQHFESQKP